MYEYAPAEYYEAIPTDSPVVNIILHVYVDVVTASGVRRRICNHHETRYVENLSAAEIEPQMDGLKQAAYEGFDFARRFDQVRKEPTDAPISK